RSSWGSFMALRKTTDDNVLNMLNEAIDNNEFKAGTDQSKAVSLYKSQLDSTARNEAGFDPIKPVMEKIEEISDLKSLKQTLSENPIEISNPFYGIYASAKLEESSMNGAYLSPGGLGLPDRDYYTNDSEDAQKVREQYKDHIARMFKYWGEDEDTAKDKAERILALETYLDEPRLTKEESRNVTKLNNPRSIEELAQLTPEIDWKQVIKDLPVKKDIDTINVSQIKYTEALNNILAETDIEDLKLLVSWQTLNDAASQLTTELEKANWDFYSKTLNGVPQQRPAEERALARVNGTVGEALGKIYVDKYFPPEAKETAETMVNNVMEVYKDRIKDLDWMTKDTKEKAIEKVNAMTVKIGYPDKWKDYSNMEIEEDNSYYDNLKAASA